MLYFIYHLDPSGELPRAFFPLQPFHKVEMNDVSGSVIFAHAFQSSF